MGGVKSFASIGSTNRLWRLVFGIIFLLAGAWLRLLVLMNGFPASNKALVMIPFYLGFLGLYQAIFGFCVFKYQWHIRQGGKKKRRKVKISRTEYCRAKKRATQIHALSIVSALILTVIFFFL